MNEILPKLKRYKCLIEYEGTDYFGWQKQSHTAETIQEKIETAIFNFSQQRVEVFGCGRTDTGVHALGQVAHFDLDNSKRNYSAEKICAAINAYLVREKIILLSVEEVGIEFHARFDAVQRSYEYHILNRKIPPTFNRNIVTHIPYELSVSKMAKAAEYFLGEHDLTSFRASHCQAKSPIKTIDEIYFTQNGEHIIFHVAAKSFLHHQIRNMIGTLFEIGCGKWDIEALPKIIEARDRSAAGPTAKPNGLFFKKVIYPE